MDKSVARPAQPQAPAVRRVRFILLAAVILVLIGGFFAYSAGANQNRATPQARAELISERAFEDRYGIRIMMIGVSAADGLIDFRFKVLDAEKAVPLMRDPANMPALIVEDSGATLKAPEGMVHNLELKNGGAYFILYPNVQDAIKPGTRVTALFGDVRLEPIIAK